MATITIMAAPMVQKSVMIDIHCHILPGIDDGAGTPQEAREMLDLQLSSGVNQLFMTPHYHPERTPLEKFLSARECAWEALEPLLSGKDSIQIRLGAEVRYCPQLLKENLKELTLGDSDYLLLELPSRRCPAYMGQFMEELLGMGVLPVLAHVERCAYFREKPELLKNLVDLGVLAQVSAGALFDRKDRNFARACLEHGLAQIIASDAHNIVERKPNIMQVDRLSAELRQQQEVFSCAVWDNKLPPYFKAEIVKKTLLGYR